MVVGPLAKQAKEWEELTVSIAKAAAANPEEVGAASYDYLMYSGYMALAYWWARSVAAAEASDRSEGFKASKRETARFYFQRVLPRTLAHAEAIRSGAGSLMSLDAAHFDA